MPQVQTNLTSTGLIKWPVPQFLGFYPLLKCQLFSITEESPSLNPLIHISFHLPNTFKPKVFIWALRVWEKPPSFAFSPGDGKLCCTLHTHGEGHYMGCGNAMAPAIASNNAAQPAGPQQEYWHWNAPVWCSQDAFLIPLELVFLLPINIQRERGRNQTS